MGVQRLCARGMCAIPDSQHPILKSAEQRCHMAMIAASPQPCEPSAPSLNVRACFAFAWSQECEAAARPKEPPKVSRYYQPSHMATNAHVAHKARLRCSRTKPLGGAGSPKAKHNKAITEHSYMANAMRIMDMPAAKQPVLLTVIDKLCTLPRRRAHGNGGQAVKGGAVSLNVNCMGRGMYAG